MTRRLLSLSLSAALVLTLAACATGPQLKTEPLARADAAMQKFIDDRQMPGGVLWIGQGAASHHRAFGMQSAEAGSAPVDEDTLFDAASLTKPVVTATLVQILRERGLLEIDAPVQRYLPDCGNVAGVTLRNLLTHTSGLPSGLPGKDPFKQTPEPSSTTMAQTERQALIHQAVERTCAQKPETGPGQQFKYSDLNFILLGEIVARVSGQPLQELAQREIFEPLGMKRSGYLPLERGVMPASIAPTHKPTENWERGAVHDPTARRMGGVAGHAGLFTTMGDLARFAQMLLNDGVSTEGRRILSHESIVLLETPQSPAGVADVRSLGWDVATPYSRPRGTLYREGQSFGHTGFTGCAVWLDPASRSFFILLANRVNEPQGTNTLPLYALLGTLAAEAAGLQPAP